MRSRTDRRRVLRSPLPAAVGAAIAALAWGVAALAAPPADGRRVVAADGDTFVVASAADANFGDEPTLRVAADPPAAAYLRFHLNGVVTQIERATLEVYALTAAPAGLTVRRVRTGWREGAVTWRKRPRLTASHVESGAFAGGRWVRIDVTPLVDELRGDLALLRSDAGPPTLLASKEAGLRAPRLVVEGRLHPRSREPANRSPTTEPDAAAVPEDGEVRVPVADLLANDIDPDADALTIAGVAGGDDAHGVVSLVDDEVVYRPAADYHGTATFRYDVSDGRGGSTTATVSVAVAPVNDAPVAADDGASGTEDSPLDLSAAVLLANDTDVDADVLAISAVEATPETNGVVTLVPGGVVYTPAPNFHGVASFRYVVGDGAGGSAGATVRVDVAPVNDAPTATDDDVAAVEDATLLVPPGSLTANDEDADGDALSIADVVVGPETHGAVTLLADGSLRYEPLRDYHGPASFGYSVRDASGATASASVAVSVAEVNDAPVAGPDALTTEEDVALTVPAAELLVNDADVDGDALSIVSVTAAAGSAVLDGDLVRYVPPAEVAGEAGFSYLVSDGRGGEASGLVAVSITPVNDAPVAHDDALATDQAAALSFPASLLMGNDVDPDGDALAVESVAPTPTTNGTISLAGDVVTYVPDAAFAGVATFTYGLADGHGGTATGTAHVTVTRITAVVETQPMPNAGDAADDPAIWVHPTDPALSLVVGTDKQGGLAVYDLDGTQIQYLPEGRMNNVDLRDGVRLGGALVSLVVSGDRTTKKIRAFRVDPAARSLVPVDGRPTRSIVAGFPPLGVCLSAAGGVLYAFVTGESGGLEQWRLFDDGTGQIDAVRVRAVDVGGETEGCVADDDRGVLYVGEEDVGIWRYDVDPATGSARTKVAATAPDGPIAADVEGLAIADGPGGTGYLIASSQGDSTYAVFRREGANEYVRSFRIRPGAVDGVSATDGLDVTTRSLGPRFPNGLLVVQDDVNCIAAVQSCGLSGRANQNFKLVPFETLHLLLGSG